jgi:quercetin dioxygenase-like cupin family protein
MPDPTLPEPLRPLRDGRIERGVAAAERALRADGVDPVAWSNRPGDRYAAHEHTYEKVLRCAEGSITFLVGHEATPVELHAGDGFVLPRDTRHAAVVGPDGCTCVEGHRP